MRRRSKGSEWPPFTDTVRERLHLPPSILQAISFLSTGNLQLFSPVWSVIISYSSSNRLSDCYIDALLKFFTIIFTAIVRITSTITIINRRTKSKTQPTSSIQLFVLAINDRHYLNNLQLYLCLPISAGNSKAN